MAQAGPTFEKKYVYHGQLCQISPFVGQVTGYKDFHPGKEPLTVFFKVQGDAEGEYGVKMEPECPGYEEAWKHACHEHREQWMTISCEGMAKEGKGAVMFCDLDGEILATNADRSAAPTAAAPAAQKAQAAPSAPAQRTNGGTAGFPYVSQEERYREALQAASNLVTERPLDHDLIQRLAVSMTISQEHIHRQTGQWVPLATKEDRERRAVEEEIEALRILFGSVVLEVPDRERKALEDLLAKAPAITYGAVCKAADYLGRLAQEVADARKDDSPSQDPPAEGEPQASMALGGEDDLPF